MLGYRLYRDLERGWRITAPNLEQSGLLEIDYASLDESAPPRTSGTTRHPALADGDARAARAIVAHVLLDYLRRELAIKVDYLDAETGRSSSQQRSSQRLVEPWAIDEDEQLVARARRSTRGRAAGDGLPRRRLPLGPRRLRPVPAPPATFASRRSVCTLDDTEHAHRASCSRRSDGTAWSSRSSSRRRTRTSPATSSPPSAMRWQAGDGTRAVPRPDPRARSAPDDGARTNPFFVDFYRDVAADGQGIEAREHTAQVPSEEREEREERFRDGELPVLFCSPTMELGVDIAELNVVNMRNVPPTPANYAQRSAAPAAAGSRRSCSPTARPAARTTSTSSAARR